MTLKTRRRFSKFSINDNWFRLYLWLLSYLAPYKIQVSLFIICSVMIASIQLSIPMFIKELLDQVVPSKDLIHLIRIISFVTILTMFMYCLIIYRNTLQKTIREKGSRDIQRALFNKLRVLGYSYFEKHAVGETLSLFNTELPAVKEIFSLFPNLVKSFVILVLSAALMISINGLLSLIIIPCFLSYYLIGPYFEKKTTMFSREAKKARSIYNKQIYNSVSAIMEVRANCSESWNINRTLDSQNELHYNLTFQNLYANLRAVIRKLTINFGLVAVFIGGAMYIQQGILSIGAFVAFLFYYMRVLHGVADVVNQTTNQKVLMFQAEVLHNFYSQTPEITESINPIKLEKVEGRLSFQNVHFKYEHSTAVLNGFNLEVEAGEKVALVGTSGNGKSTLLKLICRFYDPQVGRILLDGVDISQLRLSQLRDLIGYVSQETYLFGLSVKENIRFGNPEASDDDVISAAKLAYAHQFIMDLPEGYDTQVGERGVKLSGGQKQRICIARMILKKPSIIILDEATSALDNISEFEVINALNKLSSGKTTITVAHRISTVQNYDRIVVLDCGSIAESGTYEQLIKKRGIFYNLVNREG